MFNKLIGYVMITWINCGSLKNHEAISFGREDRQCSLALCILIIYVNRLKVEPFFLLCIQKYVVSFSMYLSMRKAIVGLRRSVVFILVCETIYRGMQFDRLSFKIAGFQLSKGN